MERLGEVHALHALRLEELGALLGCLSLSRSLNDEQMYRVHIPIMRVQHDLFGVLDIETPDINCLDVIVGKDGGERATRNLEMRFLLHVRMELLGESIGKGIRLASSRPPGHKRHRSSFLLLTDRRVKAISARPYTLLVVAGVTFDKKTSPTETLLEPVRVGPLLSLKGTDFDKGPADLEELTHPIGLEPAVFAALSH